MVDNPGTQAKSATHYIDNRKLYDELVRYKVACQQAKDRGEEPPRLSSYVGECIMLLARNIGMMSCFRDYSYLDEMVNDGIENCIMYGISNFNPKRCYPDKVPTPYSYFTQIITWAFIRRIQKEKKQHYIKLKNCRKQIIIEQLHDNRYTPPVDEANNDKFIKEFEEKIAEKKEKRGPPPKSPKTIDQKVKRYVKKTTIVVVATRKRAKKK